MEFSSLLSVAYWALIQAQCMVIHTAAYLLKCIPLAARAFYIVGKRHFDGVGFSGMKAIMPVAVIILIHDEFSGEIQIFMIGNILLR